MFDQNISLIFYVKDGSYARLWHLSFVFITAQRQYTAVQNMRSPLKELSLHYNLASTETIVSNVREMSSPKQE